jgi:hypothetical protein
VSPHLLGVVDTLRWEGLGFEHGLDLLAQLVWDLLVVGRVEEEHRLLNSFHHLQLYQRPVRHHARVDVTRA